MKRLKLNLKRQKTKAWDIYCNWYSGMFKRKASDTEFYSKHVEARIKLKTCIYVLFESLGKDSKEFVAYLDYVVKSWSEVRGNKSLADLPYWIGSPKMFDRYQQSKDIEVYNAGYNKTVSSHGSRAIVKNKDTFKAGFLL